MSRLTLPLKWHGGKYYLAPQIVDLMPAHIHYVEPFAGGLSVLLAHPADDRSELVNDIDKDLTNFWQVLQDDEQFRALSRRLEATPLSRIEWAEATDGLDADDPVDRAVAFFVSCRQSLAGRRKCFTPPTRTRTRRGMNGNVSEWLGAVEGLADVHARIRRIMVENMPAVDLIRREDGPSTLFYCDPPYLPESRSSPDVYAHEMTRRQHAELLGTLRGCQGKVMLSGYSSRLYNAMLPGWNRHTFDLPNQSAGGSSKRRMIEIVWCNF